MADKRQITAEEHRTQINAYDEVIATYETYAAVLKRVLEQACKTSFPDAFVQSREKSLSSFAEKAARKFSTYPDAVHQMKDLCGARVIVQTTEQVRAVRQFIEANFKVLEQEDKGLLLSEDAFGYRDMHYVVQLRLDRDESLGIAPAEREQIGDKRAEIQVRTWLQHAWADTLHDRIYKIKLKIPSGVKRTGNLLAALMEEGDRIFNDLAEDLDGLIANYSSYATKEELLKEIAVQELILGSERDPEMRPALALKLASLVAACGDHRRVVELLEPHEGIRDANRTALLLQLGYHLCRQNRGAPASPEYKRGRGHVEAAVESCKGAEASHVPHLRKRESLRARAWHHLGWVLEVNEQDAGRAAECHQKAHEHEPANPYYLAGMLGFEMYRSRGVNPAETLRTTIQEAIKTCQQHSEAEIELPFALFTAARLHLLLDESDLALASYARGLRHCLKGEHCVPPDVLEEESKWIARLHFGSRDRPASCQRAIELLSLGQRIQDREEPTGSPVPMKRPVLIVAGGAESMDADTLAVVHEHLLATAAEFHGTVISGGTTVGVPGCMGDVAAELARGKSRRFDLVGYTPQKLPHNVTPHPAYGELVKVGDDFSADQILRNWADILAAGINPQDVYLLGFGGGSLSALEYRIALGLGATVGIVVDIAGASVDLLDEPLWSTLPNLYPLPNDTMTIRAFVLPRKQKLAPPVLEDMAKEFHARYVAGNTKSLPANMKPWEKLGESYRKANFEQAASAVQILESIGFGVRKADKPVVFDSKNFTPDEVESMAEMEHGRWNVERLRDGWRFGPRDDAKKLHDCLIPWDRLPDGPEGVRRYDREGVCSFPAILAKAGLEVYRPARPAGEHG